jgi:hypothetical protein
MQGTPGSAWHLVFQLESWLFAKLQLFAVSTSPSCIVMLRCIAEELNLVIVP